MIDCFVALGGNLAGTLEAMKQAVTQLKSLQGIQNFAISKLYKSSPVSSIPQPHYLNAVCRFLTDRPLQELWGWLQRLERELGKERKAKNEPRTIDLDLLFFGDLSVETDDLRVPHPRWQERLFVLAPLGDVAEKLPSGIEMKKLMDEFTHPHQEEVVIVKEKWCDA